jgi:hypothetical protein
MLNIGSKGSDPVHSELFICTNLIPHITILVHSKYIHCIISFASFIVESGVKNHKNDKPPPLVVCEKIYLISFLGHLEFPPHGTSPTPQRNVIF